MDPDTRDSEIWILRLSALLRTVRAYQTGNDTLRRQLKEIKTLLDRWSAEKGEVSIVMAGGHVFVNNDRVRPRPSLLSIQAGLRAEFSRHGLGGIRILSRATEEEISRFFELLTTTPNDGTADLVAALNDAQIDSLVPFPPMGLDESPADIHVHPREKARRAYGQAVDGVRRIMVDARRTGRPDLRQAKRLTQPLVDTILRHEYSIFGLTAIKEHDVYTYAHCVNVSILSVGIGQALGLHRQALADLGVAALLHDIGKTRVPGEILRKPDSLTSEEWRTMRRHTIEGLKIISRMPGLSPLSLDSMHACFEHHMSRDGSGYPRVGNPWRPSAVSRIASVADVFDAMTAHRAYRAVPMTPYEALQHVLGGAGDRFDPAAVWGLVRTVGLYPPGTILVTRSGAIVNALHPNPADPSRPFCRLLARSDGEPIPDGIEETWDPMPADESVDRVLDAAEAAVYTGIRRAA